MSVIGTLHGPELRESVIGERTDSDDERADQEGGEGQT